MSQRKPLLLLPGLMCDQTVWGHQMENLSDIADIRVADYGDADSIEGMAERVLSDAPDRFALAGHSMGGRTAFQIVKMAPERVERLALLGTHYVPRAEGEPGEKELAGRMALVELARTKGVRAMGEVWVRDLVAPHRLEDRVLVGQILDMIERKPAAIFEAQVKALLTRPDSSDAAASIRCPTLILAGGEDRLFTLRGQEEMSRGIVGSRLAVVERCGHMLTMEQPEEVSSLLREWLVAA